jgi:hypothetical protein
MGKKQRNQDKKAEKVKRSEQRSEKTQIRSQIEKTQALLSELESIPKQDIDALHDTLSRNASLHEDIDHLYPGAFNRVQEPHNLKRSMKSLEEKTEPTQEDLAEMQALLKQMGFKKHSRPLCRVCMLVPATKVCCEGARYCGAECSKKDWPNHRTICTNPQKLQQRERSLMQRMQHLTTMPAEGAIASAREEAEKEFTAEGYEELD